MLLRVASGCKAASHELICLTCLGMLLYALVLQVSPLMRLSLTSRRAESVSAVQNRSEIPLGFGDCIWQTIPYTIIPVFRLYMFHSNIYSLLFSFVSSLFKRLTQRFPAVSLVCLEHPSCSVGIYFPSYPLWVSSRITLLQAKAKR